MDRIESLLDAAQVLRRRGFNTKETTHYGSDALRVYLSNMPPAASLDDCRPAVRRIVGNAFDIHDERIDAHGDLFVLTLGTGKDIIGSRFY